MRQYHGSNKTAREPLRAKRIDKAHYVPSGKHFSTRPKPPAEIKHNRTHKAMDVSGFFLQNKSNRLLLPRMLLKREWGMGNGEWGIMVSGNI